MLSPFNYNQRGIGLGVFFVLCFFLGGGEGRRRSFNTICAHCCLHVLNFSYWTEKNTLSNTNPQSGQYLTHAHSHVTWAVAAMNSCFGLVSPHQHGIAIRQKVGLKVLCTLPGLYCWVGCKHPSKHQLHTTHVGVHRAFSPIFCRMAMLCWWGLTRLKQLSMAATAWVIGWYGCVHA